MSQKVIESNAFEGGADVLVGVTEQEVVADLFDRELDAVSDQQLIAIGDREVFDGVAAFGEAEAVGPLPADERVISFAAIELIVVIAAMEPIVAGFAFELVIAFSASEPVVLAVADQGVVAKIPNQGVAAVFADQGVGENIALKGVGFAVAGEDAIPGGEETWVDDRTIGDAIAIPGWVTVGWSGPRPPTVTFTSSWVDQPNSSG